jgi:hypothetical protein
MALKFPRVVYMSGVDRSTSSGVWYCADEGIRYQVVVLYCDCATFFDTQTVQRQVIHSVKAKNWVANL